MSKVEIITDGKTISGWNSVNIKRSMTELCHSFELSFSNKWVDEFPPIYAGAKCIIKIDDVKILTGYIDNIITNITSNNIEYNISGRSKTEDLVDCNRIKSPFTWNNKDIKLIDGKSPALILRISGLPSSEEVEIFRTYKIKSKIIYDYELRDDITVEVKPYGN